MAATTEDRNTPKRGNDLVVIPVAAATTIPAGVQVARNAAGNAVNASDAAGLLVLGRSNERVANTGDAGAKSIEIERGVFLWENDAANAVTAAHVGEMCYALDNQTVSSDAGGNDVIAGVVHAVVPDVGVWVDTTLGTLRGPTGPTGPTGATGE